MKRQSVAPGMRLSVAAGSARGGPRRSMAAGRDSSIRGPGMSQGSATLARGMGMSTMRGETMSKTGRVVTVADTRPIGDRAWRRNAAERVTSWLLGHGYDSFVFFFPKHTQKNRLGFHNSHM